MHFALELRLVVILNHILFNLFFQFKQRLLKRQPCDRLQKILINADFNGFSGIFEIVISADNHNFGFGELLTYNFAQRQPVHKGHFYICNEHIRPCLPDHRQSHFSVRRFSHKPESILFPGNLISQAVPDHSFVFHKKYL